MSRASGGTYSAEYAARSLSVAFTTSKAGLRGGGYAKEVAIVVLLLSKPLKLKLIRAARVKNLYEQGRASILRPKRGSKGPKDINFRVPDTEDVFPDM